MKKILAIALALVLSTVFASCGKDDRNTAGDEDNRNGVVGSVVSDVSTDVATAVSDMSTNIIDNESERESEMSERDTSATETTTE